MVDQSDPLAVKRASQHNRKRRLKGYPPHPGKGQSSTIRTLTNNQASAR